MLQAPQRAAVEPELVVIGRAAFGVLQAVRQQEQPPLERNRRPPGRTRTRWPATPSSSRGSLRGRPACSSVARATDSISSFPNGRDLSSLAATSAQRARNCSRASLVSGTSFRWLVLRRPFLERFALSCSAKGCSTGAVAKVEPRGSSADLVSERKSSGGEIRGGLADLRGWAARGPAWRRSRGRAGSPKVRLSKLPRLAPTRG